MVKHVKNFDEMWIKLVWNIQPVQPCLDKIQTWYKMPDFLNMVKHDYPCGIPFLKKSLESLSSRTMFENILKMFKMFGQVEHV
jgi:hypothetical protein